MPNLLYTYILNMYDLVWFFGISTIVSYFMPNIFLHVNSSISNNLVEHKNSFVYAQLNVKTILFQIIQLSISTLLSYISEDD